MFPLLFPLIALIVVLLFAWWWRCSMQAKEIAIDVGHYRCKQKGLQLLDETVALKSLKIKRGEDGQLHVQRIYQFEYNDGSLVRKKDILTMIGSQVADVDVLENEREDNVVEFKRS